MLSAHGSAPEVVAAARANGGFVVDAVCPLVTKVHHEVKVRAGKGYRIVYVGHEGHEEAVGTMAVAPDAIHLVETGRRRRRPARRSTQPVALLAQTTLSATATGPACSTPPRERFPEMWMPGRSDLCFATTNRQSALTEIAAALRRRRRDRLGQLVEHAWPSRSWPASRAAPGCYRVNGADELPDDLDGHVGVTAGASAPEELVDAVIARLAPARRRRGGRASPTRTSTSRRPRELRELLAARRRRRHGHPRRLRRRPARASTTARSQPATCSAALARRRGRMTP